MQTHRAALESWTTACYCNVCTNSERFPIDKMTCKTEEREEYLHIALWHCYTCRWKQLRLCSVCFQGTKHISYDLAWCPAWAKSITERKLPWACGEHCANGVIRISDELWLMSNSSRAHAELTHICLHFPL